MRLLYVTADQISAQSGGGLVTRHESEAFASLGECVVLDRSVLCGGSEPWGADAAAVKKLATLGDFDLAHFYAGTFGDTAHYLKSSGCKIVWTIAAHDRAVSRREHEKLGIDFAGNFPHLVQPELWRRYIEGYRLADVIVCPGSVPAQTVREYGGEFATKRIEIIPHGCDIPTEKCWTCLGRGTVSAEYGISWQQDAELPCDRCGGNGNITVTPAPLPDRFVCGYLGSFFPDKGVVYLMQVWKKLNYPDALLILAGRDSTSPWVRQMWQQFGSGNVHFAGWQESVSDSYNGISLFVCPATTEGFNIEVLEAMAHGRMVICSRGAGACDLLDSAETVAPCDVDELAAKIDDAKCRWNAAEVVKHNREQAGYCSWDKIRQRYVDLWRSLL